MITLLCGDALQILKTLPDCSVQTVVTSPPYYGLRDYGTARWEGGNPACDHIANPKMTKHFGNPEFNKNRPSRDETKIAGYYQDICPKCGAVRIDSQLGLEKTPEAYIANMVAVFREVRRVLRDDGTLWLNVGDSYWGANWRGSEAIGSKQATNRGANGSQHSINKMQISREHDDLKPKDLIGIPWMLAFALRADGWWLRNDIIWSKPNPMPESVRDRCTKSHEYIFLLTKSAKYFFDQEAVREPQSKTTLERDKTPRGRRQNGGGSQESMTGIPYTTKLGNMMSHPNGRNIRTVWTIVPHPYSGAHFATFPEKLVEPCIHAGTSEQGCCPKCGKAWVRVTERQNESNWEFRKTKGAVGGSMIEGNKQQIGAGWSHDLPVKDNRTIDWQPACTCDAGAPVPCAVLDPFQGAGTTGVVCQKLGRDYIGIDIKPEYLDMTRERLAKIKGG